MVCATTFLDANRGERKREMEARGKTAPKVIRTNDEAWRALPIAGLGEYYQAAFKLARQTGVQHWLVLHRFSDLRAAGDEGTRQQRLAEGLLADASTTIVYHQHAKEAAFTSELLGLSSTEGELIKTLHQGEALWRVGNRSFLVYHVLSDLEQRLVDTDSAMLELDPHHEPELVDHYTARHAAGEGLPVMGPDGAPLHAAGAAAAGGGPRARSWRHERPLTVRGAAGRRRRRRLPGDRQRPGRRRLAARLDRRRDRRRGGRRRAGARQPQRRRHRAGRAAQPPERPGAGMAGRRARRAAGAHDDARRPAGHPRPARRAGRHRAVAAGTGSRRRREGPPRGPLGGAPRPAPPARQGTRARPRDPRALPAPARRQRAAHLGARRRPDAVGQDHEPRGPHDPGVGRPGAGDVDQGRSGAGHARRALAAGRGQAVRPDQLHRAADRGVVADRRVDELERGAAHRRRHPAHPREGRLRRVGRRSPLEARGRAPAGARAAGGRAQLAPDGRGAALAGAAGGRGHRRRDRRRAGDVRRRRRRRRARRPAGPAGPRQPLPLVGDRDARDGARPVA